MNSHIQTTLADVLNAAHTATGAGICLYDLDRFFVLDRERFQCDYTRHHCEFCKAVRNLPGGREACIASDVDRAVQLARVHEQPFFHICHMGLRELVVPIRAQAQLVGVVFLGQCRLKQQNPGRMISRARELGGDETQLLTLYGQLPESDAQVMMAMGRLIGLSIDRLIEQQGGLKKLLEQQPPDLCGQIMEYIEQYYTQPITPVRLSRQFHVSQSYLARLFKNKTGNTLVEYITRVRINNAKALLSQTTMPVAAVAGAVGYPDHNYFTRCFKRFTGFSPVAYRKRAKGQEPVLFPVETEVSPSTERGLKTGVDC